MGNVHVLAARRVWVVFFFSNQIQRRFVRTHSVMLCVELWTGGKTSQLSCRLVRHAYNKQCPFERWNENADVEADVRKKQDQMRGRCVKELMVT